MSRLENLVKRIVEENYDVGSVKKVKQCTAGTMNRSFIVTCEKNNIDTKYFFKQYYAGRTEEEVIYEHAVIQHFRAQGRGVFSLSVKLSGGKRTLWMAGKRLEPNCFSG